MPNIMIHEKVANYIAKKININSYNYYLGVLTPDAPNTYGFAPKIDRWTAHIRRKDYNEWRNSLIDFYNENKEKYEYEFLLGYFIHILTDIVFDDFLYLKVREEILKDNIKLEESHDVMRLDMDNYYFNEIEQIKEILKSKNTTYDINNISKELLLEWKILSIQSFVNENKSKYITEEIIKDLEKQVYNELISLNII